MLYLHWECSHILQDVRQEGRLAHTLPVNFTAKATDSMALDARDLPCASDSAASACKSAYSGRLWRSIIGHSLCTSRSETSINNYRCQTQFSNAYDLALTHTNA